MTIKWINRQQLAGTPSERLSELQEQLVQLVGEPFQFARVSYGEELTLHFGDLRPARSPKLKHLKYGAYILGMQASPWMLKSENALAHTLSHEMDSITNSMGEPLAKEALEANPVIVQGSRVLEAFAFSIQPEPRFGLVLRLSDGSNLVVRPDIPEPDSSEDAHLPELADWELITPNGLLSVGPGAKWTYEPAIDSSAPTS